MTDRLEELKRGQAERRRAPSATQPHFFYLEGFFRNLNEPFEVREAAARKYFYEKTPIEILPGEAIVGQMDWNEPLVCTYANTHIEEGVLQRILDSELPVADKKRVTDMIAAVRPFCFDPFGSGIFTREEKLAHERALAPSTFFNGHMVPAFDYVLARGLGGMLEDVSQNRARPLTKEEGDFYDAMETAVEGISAWIMRYAELAHGLIKSGAPGYSADQLRQIAEICGRISHEPAHTYPEALQLTWFFMALTDYDSFGRTDQYLYPYYLNSLEGGMPVEEAALWTKYMLFKAEECDRILNMTIGGQHADGSSAVNDLTWLMLRCVRENGYRSPNLALRISADSPDSLWTEAHRSISAGQGLPALYNDGVAVPMLVEMGFSIEDARGYCLAGCSQVVLPGCSNFACDVGCYNLLKALELAMRDGRDGITGDQVGPRTGLPESLDSYEKLKAAYDEQMRYMVKAGTSINNKDVRLRRREGAVVRSLVSHDCIERGKGFFHGGARFHAVQNEACGITNAADSLLALKKFIYEEKRMPLHNLVKALDSDWEGRETLRLELKNRYDKFGNDSGEVDAIRASIAADWYREMQQYAGELGGVHWPGEVVFTYHETYGKLTAASPDGRRCGQPMASSAGASSGMDRKGPTALFNSMLKLPQRECRTCCVLNVSFIKALWQENASQMTALIRSYFARGGYQLQVNILDRDALRNAKRDPEQYSGLIVRVGGFSDYFCRLPPALQDEIIERTSFVL